MNLPIWQTPYGGQKVCTSKPKNQILILIEKYDHTHKKNANCHVIESYYVIWYDMIDQSMIWYDMTISLLLNFNGIATLLYIYYHDENYHLLYVSLSYQFVRHFIISDYLSVFLFVCYPFMCASLRSYASLLLSSFHLQLMMRNYFIFRSFLSTKLAFWSLFFLFSFFLVLYSLLFQRWF